MGVDWAWRATASERPGFYGFQKGRKEKGDGVLASWWLEISSSHSSAHLPTCPLPDQFLTSSPDYWSSIACPLTNAPSRSFSIPGMARRNEHSNLSSPRALFVFLPTRRLCIMLVSCLAAVRRANSLPTCRKATAIDRVARAVLLLLVCPGKCY